MIGGRTPGAGGWEGGVGLRPYGTDSGVGGGATNLPQLKTVLAATFVAMTTTHIHLRPGTRSAGRCDSFTRANTAIPPWNNMTAPARAR